MTTSAPFPQAAFSSVSPASIEHALTKAVESGPLLVALFDHGSRRLQYVNGKAQQLLNPGNRVDWSQSAHTLEDFIGPSSADVFQSAIRTHVDVLGRWQGNVDLLNVWGNEIPSVASFTLVTAEPGVRFICLQAATGDLLEGASSAKGTDQVFVNALLNHLPDWLYFKDKAGRYLRASQSHATHVGCEDPCDLIGRTAFDFFSVERAAAIHACEQQILSTLQPVLDQEESEALPGGGALWMSTTRLPLHDLSGELLGTFGVSRNISVRKKTEDERRELELQLQLAHKLESIGMLAAGVAHEINTPTQFITDNTRFVQNSFKQVSEAIRRYRALVAAVPALAADAACIEDDTELDYLIGEVPRTLDQSMEGLGRVARIVGSLKEFSHPNTLERRPADLNRAIETTLTVARHEWKYVAEVVTELDPALPSVPCILDEFNQVVLNLIINACHAIEDVLKVTHAAKGLITLRTRQDGDWACIEVTDSGAGIPVEIRDRIFELFFTTKRADKGTGQGLALVRTIIVQHHGGAVDFTSEVGKGTTFRIRLPLTVETPAKP
jgi:PAS domain S-box-containing protein